jgi:DNA repair exonuclease SbcCD nuclease subunit
MADEVKIIHTGDLHLGMTFKSLGEKSKLHRRDCQDVFSNIIELTIKEKANALLIAGDLFDEPNPSKSIVTFVIDELKKLKNENIPVFIITGNHDPYKKDSLWFSYSFPSNVVIFDSNNLEPKSIGDLEVYGLAYTNNTKEPLKGFKAEKSDKFKVGLIHGSTTNIKEDDDPEYSYRPITKTQIDGSGLDYIALGHFHDLLEVKSKVKCFYCGSPEGLSFKNKSDSGVLIVTYSNGKVTVKPHKTAIREFHNVEIDCTKLDNDSEIRKTLQKNKGDNKILRLILKGSPSLDFHLDKELLEKEFSSEYFYMKIDDKIHIPDNLQEDETIRGQFIKFIKQEIQKEKDQNKKKKLENALRIGIGHLDKKL